VNEHVDTWIPELVLGTLEDELRADVEHHLERCARCAAEAAATGEALSLLALALPPEHPHPTARTRLLTSVAEQQRGLEEVGGGRLGTFVEQLASFFDVTAERARTLIDLVSDRTAWTIGPATGVSLIHILPGPRFAGADAGFVRMAPGARFPRHRHLGHEFGLILEGGFTDESGVVVRAGERHELAAGTSHDFVALPEGCLFAALVLGGIEFLESLAPD
jgi:putative transcriptional regulator